MNKHTGKEIAMKVVSVRQRVRARVESVKGQVGVCYFLHSFSVLLVVRILNSVELLINQVPWVAPPEMKKFQIEL